MAATVQTTYARSGGVHIAYQVVGDGPFDLVFSPSPVSNLDVAWEWPPFARFLRRLASFCRVLRFDRRGTGASDPLPQDPLPPWEAFAGWLRPKFRCPTANRSNSPHFPTPLRW